LYWVHIVYRFIVPHFFSYDFGRDSARSNDEMKVQFFRRKAVFVYPKTISFPQISQSDDRHCRREMSSTFQYNYIPTTTYIYFSTVIIIYFSTAWSIECCQIVITVIHRGYTINNHINLGRSKSLDDDSKQYVPISVRERRYARLLIMITDTQVANTIVVIVFVFKFV